MMLTASVWNSTGTFSVGPERSFVRGAMAFLRENTSSFESRMRGITVPLLRLRPYKLIITITSQTNMNLVLFNNRLSCRLSLDS